MQVLSPHRRELLALSGEFQVHPKSRAGLDLLGRGAFSMLGDIEGEPGEKAALRRVQKNVHAN
jgi:hypothetical protein